MCVVLWYMSSGNDKTNVMTFNPHGERMVFKHEMLPLYVVRGQFFLFHMTKVKAPCKIIV